MAYTITCKECGGEMENKHGTSKKGKPYSGWFCENEKCKAVIWTKVDQVEVHHDFPKKEAPKAEPKADGVDWAEKDRRMYAQNALRHADEWISIFVDMAPEDREVEYFRHAERCYQWIMTK